MIYLRLWHQDMISKLSRQHLLGQHREVCALRGKGWGKKHSIVDYVFTYPYYYLFAYHMLVMQEMKNRGYKPNVVWENPSFRGNIIGEDHSDFTGKCQIPDGIIYPEHNQEYMAICLKNLVDKGFSIEDF